jgi:O-methyltransferase
VDVDIYRSVLDCCRFFYPRLVTGGAIVFDDYGRNSCPGAKAAVDEFFADTPEQPVYVATGQAFVVKH